MLLIALVSLGAVTSSSTCFAQDTPIPDQRLAALRQLNRSGKHDVAVLNSVLSTRFSDTLRADAEKAVDEALKLRDPNTGPRAGALRFFVERGGKVSAILRRYIIARLPNAEPDEKIELLSIVRSMGISDSETVKHLRLEAKHAERIVQLYAISALCRAEPQETRHTQALHGFLKSSTADMLWRAADAVGACEAKSPQIKDRLGDLLLHEDVRVRAAAGFALWKLTADVERTLPVLVDAISKKDEPLALGFVYPSNQGDSHRAYVANALGSMRRKNVNVLSQLLDLVETASNDDHSLSADRAFVGLTALSAIADSGPVPETTYLQILKYASKKNSIYQQQSRLTQETLDRVTVEAKK